MVAHDAKSQVEMRLERTLSEEECVEVATLEELTKTQLALIAALVGKGAGVAAFIYASAVVPSAAHPDVRRLVYEIDDVIESRFPQPAHGLRFESNYARELGRPPTVEERLPAASLESLSQAHLDVASWLARSDIGLASAYLWEVVPRSDAHRRSELAEQLSKTPNRSRQVEELLHRCLTASELAHVASVEELAAEQVEVARSLVRESRLRTLEYLRWVVPDATTGTLMTYIEKLDVDSAARNA